MNIDKLNMDLMNIPCNVEERHPEWTDDNKLSYRFGHRDARHAAVEVVLEHAKDFERGQWEKLQKVILEVAKFCFGGPEQEGNVSMSAAYIAVVTSLTSKDGLNIKLN